MRGRGPVAAVAPLATRLSQRRWMDRLLAFARRKAEAATRERIALLAEKARDRLPPGLAAEAEEEGVMITGGNARRRVVTDPALRWLAGGMR